MLIKQNSDVLSNLLQKDITGVNPPSVDDNKAVKWKRGFVIGYRQILAKLKFAYETQGVEAISSKLEEIEKLIREEK